LNIRRPGAYGRVDSREISRTSGKPMSLDHTTNNNNNNNNKYNKIITETTTKTIIMIKCSDYINYFAFHEQTITLMMSRLIKVL
jgi:hypothetical protein